MREKKNSIFTFKENIDIETIIEYTGLSIKELEDLKEEDLKEED